MKAKYEAVQENAKVAAPTQNNNCCLSEGKIGEDMNLVVKRKYNIPGFIKIL
jgi:hypothetical protein